MQTLFESRLILSIMAALLEWANKVLPDEKEEGRAALKQPHLSTIYTIENEEDISNLRNQLLMSRILMSEWEAKDPDEYPFKRILGLSGNGDKMYGRVGMLNNLTLAFKTTPEPDIKSDEKKDEKQKGPEEKPTDDMGIIVAHINWDITRTSSIFKEGICAILSDLFSCDAVTKLVYEGIGLIDNLLNAENFDLVNFVDLQRLHNIIHDKDNQHAKPSLGIMLSEYGIPEKYFEDTADYHGYATLTFLRLPITRIESLTRNSYRSKEISPMNWKKKHAPYSSKKWKNNSYRGNANNHRRDDDDNRPQISVNMDTWMPKNRCSLAQLDRMCCDAWILVLLFDGMLVHIARRNKEQGSSPWLNQMKTHISRYESFLHSVTHRPHWELIFPKERNMGYIIGEQGSNIDCIRIESHASLEVYHKMGILITADSSVQIEHAKYMLKSAVESRGKYVSENDHY